MTTSIAPRFRNKKNSRPGYVMHTKRPAILPLQQGDRLTRVEFERRYKAMPHLKKYVVWRVYDGKIDWFRLEDGRYALVEADAEGIVHSRVFPGLRLNTVALLKGDLAAVLAELSAGIQSDEHAEFVSRVDAMATAKSR